jgi:hypothetical protein
VINKESQKILQYKYLTVEIQCMWNVKNKSDISSNSRGDWNHQKVIHKIPEQLTGKHEIK